MERKSKLSRNESGGKIMKSGRPTMGESNIFQAWNINMKTRVFGDKAVKVASKPIMHRYLLTQMHRSVR